MLSLTDLLWLVVSLKIWEKMEPEKHYIFLWVEENSRYCPKISVSTFWPHTLKIILTLHNHMTNKLDAPLFPTYELEPLGHYHFVSQYPHCHLGSQSLITLQGCVMEMLFCDCTPIIIPCSHCVVEWALGGFIQTSPSIWIRLGHLTSASFLRMTSECLHFYQNQLECFTTHLVMVFGMMFNPKPNLVRQ